MTGDQTYRALALGAIGVSFALLGWHLLSPPPRPALSRTQLSREELKLQIEIRDARNAVTKLRQENADRVWDLGAAQLGPRIMAEITKKAEAKKLKVISFRPQRTETEADVVRTPFLVSLEGRYPQVLEFVRDLETEASKLTVSTLQCSSADGATDAVNATVGVVAFRPLNPSKR